MSVHFENKKVEVARTRILGHFHSIEIQLCFDDCIISINPNREWFESSVIIDMNKIENYIAKQFLRQGYCPNFYYDNGFNQIHCHVEKGGEYVNTVMSYNTLKEIDNKYEFLDYFVQYTIEQFNGGKSRQ